MGRHSIPPVDDPEVIRRVVAILTAHRPAKAARPNLASKVDLSDQAVAA